MSKAPRESRSFETFDADDLKRLAELATASFTQICQPPNVAGLYAGRLRLLCLCQGAARHLRQCNEGIALEYQRGIHDIDVWGFFEARDDKPFPERPYWSDDFGESRFGVDPDDDADRVGRKVDLMGRSVAIGLDGPIEAALRWLHSNNRSPRAVRLCPVFVISPGPDFAKMIWPGTLALDLPQDEG